MAHRYGYGVDNDYWVPKERITYYQHRNLASAIVFLLPPDIQHDYHTLPNGFIPRPPLPQHPYGYAHFVPQKHPVAHPYAPLLPLDPLAIQRYPLMPQMQPSFAPPYGPPPPQGPKVVRPQVHLYLEQRPVAQAYVPPLIEQHPVAQAHAPRLPEQQQAAPHLHGAYVPGDNIDFMDDNIVEQQAAAANAEMDEDGDADDEIEEDVDGEGNEDMEEEEEDPELLEEEASDGDSVITEKEYTPLTPSDWDPEEYP